MGGASSRCPKCGGALSVADAEFCTSCGAHLVLAADAPKTITSTAPGEPSPDAFGSGAQGTAKKPSSPGAERFASGTLIDNKYKIDRVLGEGGMGVVYLAEDIHTRSYVVLKAVRPELAHRKDVRDRTLAEGRVLAQIDHPNVVQLKAIIEDSTGLWLVMQYIDGESLDRTIKRHTAEKRHVAFTIATDIFRQVLHGVAAAHREGVIHRDLKPANVLVRKKDGVAKVTDFGIAKPEEQARAGQGKTKGVIGSLWYMSPEQVQGRKDLDKRVDIYSLGILFFELLTGHVPFEADSSYELMRKHVEEPLPKVTDARSDVPAWVDDILARACAKSRDDRFGSAEEFLSVLDAHLPAQATQLPAGVTRLPTQLPAEQPVASAARPSQHTSAGTSVTRPGEGGASRAWIYAVVGVAALALGGLGVYALVQGDEPKPRTKNTQGASASTADAPGTTAPTASATASTKPAVDPLDAIAGKWRSEGGTEFEAVKIGYTVEFRIVDAKQLEPSDYRDGEARFVLRAVSDGVYKVEDKIRPQPPRGSVFDPKSRNTCQEVWTAVDGRELRAYFDGSRLTVSFAKIAPKATNFEHDGSVVIACRGLKEVEASVIQSVLTKGK
ncbi:MAG: serine/threonine protein kinase [Myxococcales bacterium]|nr:serine/threonine protein kinase [Myxococcales bacterium]